MESKILDILKKIRPEFDFTASEDFIEVGYLDSFDVVTIVSELEDEYNIIIDGLEVLPENFANIEKIKELVVKSGGEE